MSRHEEVSAWISFGFLVLTRLIGFLVLKRLIWGSFFPVLVLVLIPHGSHVPSLGLLENYPTWSGVFGLILA